MEKKFISIKPKDEKAVNIFNRIGKEWMLISAEHDGHANTMTASWGTLGYLWNKPVATVFIRPQRYTFHMADAEDRISLSFLSEEYRSALVLCGRESGRDMDKFKASNITLKHKNGVPYVEEAHTVMICRKLYADYLKENAFTDASALACYPEKDFHKFFICEIEEILIEEK